MGGGEVGAASVQATVTERIVWRGVTSVRRRPWSSASCRFDGRGRGVLISTDALPGVEGFDVIVSTKADQSLRPPLGRPRTLHNNAE
jgi:hypothetical protein